MEVAWERSLNFDPRHQINVNWWNLRSYNLKIVVGQLLMLQLVKCRDKPIQCFLFTKRYWLYEQVRKFCGLARPYSASTHVQHFLNQIYRLQGASMEIINYRNPLFVSSFSKEFFKTLGRDCTEIIFLLPSFMSSCIGKNHPN